MTGTTPDQATATTPDQATATTPDQATATTPDQATGAWETLRHRLTGALLLPGDAGYDTARRTQHASHDTLRPHAVAQCATEDDVRACIAFARTHRLALHPRSGGHSFTGRCTGTGLVVDVSPMDTVTTNGPYVTCGAGVRTDALAQALAAHQRVLPTGTCPTVGICGLTLGGGMGTLGRRLGLTLDSLVALRIVVADGRVLDCDDRHHPDLFWALRGAGQTTLGVVTSLRFRTHEETPVTDFLLGWPAPYRARVLSAWQNWGPCAPDALSTMAGLGSGESWNGLPPAAVAGTWSGNDTELDRLLAALIRHVGRSPVHTWRTKHGQLDSMRLWGSGGYRRSPPTHRRHEFFARRLPAGAIQCLVTQLDQDLGPGEGRYCDFEALGGAYNRIPPHATCFAHRGQLFGMLSQYRPGRPDGAPSSRALDRLHTMLRPWASGHAYQNYPEADRPDPAHAYYGPNADRLHTVRTAYDPHRTFSPAPAGQTPPQAATPQRKPRP